LLLLIDEVDKFLEGNFSTEIEDKLRCLSEEQNAPIKLILASRNSLDLVFAQRQVSPLVNICFQVAISHWR
jgi:hypothetical protein